MKRPTFLVVAALHLLCTAAAANPPAQGEIVRREPVRGGGNTLGEVRLIRRGDARIVETVLRTALLRRVVGEIRDKELANWQSGRPGYDDALAYIKALEEAASELVGRARRAQKRDPTLELLIEFSSSPSTVSVTLWDIEVEAKGGEFSVKDRRRLRDVPVTRDYVDRNMRLILADSFGISEAEAAALLDETPAAEGTRKDAVRTEASHD